MMWILAVLTLCGPSALGPIQGDRTVSEREMMRMWGQSIAKTMPAAIKKGGTLKQLQFAFSQYCNALDKRAVTNNSSYATRLTNLFKEGKLTKWTCGDHAELLESMFSGMGIPGKDLLYLHAVAERLQPTINQDHGTIAVLINGKLFVFDAWQVARFNGSFNLAKNVQASIWNGGDAYTWELQMIAQGYSQFQLDDRPFHKHVADALAEYQKFLKGTTPPAKTAPTTKPPTRYWVRDGDPILTIDEPRKGCTIGWDKKGILTSTGNWGGSPGVSPVEFIVTYDFELPERMKSGEEGQCDVKLIYRYNQKDLAARGYTMSVEVHVGQFAPTGDWVNNRGATNFLKVVAACNDESPNRGGPLYPVVGHHAFTAPTFRASLEGTWRFAIQFYIYGPATPTARLVQVYKTD
ncbi:MAG: hypothetical protein M9921_14530 [Fimbriimonadaceae bacterium]|nr:hypothetical protein [Chthonomonadaceae bacterium]MCO5298061.1 hypothetical protein [Fimbriimonadaceae bacterium]